MQPEDLREQPPTHLYLTGLMVNCLGKSTIELKTRQKRERMRRTCAGEPGGRKSRTEFHQRETRSESRPHLRELRYRRGQSSAGTVVAGGNVKTTKGSALRLFAKES
jgi:hypothetical protein